MMMQKKNTNIKEKIRLLRQIAESYRKSPVIIDVLEDLWRIEKLTGEQAALETYKAYLEIRGIKDTDYSKKESTALYELYAIQGRYKEAEGFLKRQLTLKQQTGDANQVKELQRLLKSTYLAQGKYTEFLSVPAKHVLDDTVRRLKLVMDAQGRHYVLYHFILCFFIPYTCLLEI